MRTLLYFIAAATCEIFGCYAAWMWLRLGRSAWWLAPGSLSLALFALILTRADAGFAGRAFAAYGGVYIVCALVWLVLVERASLRISDVAGSLLCLAGAVVILYGGK